MTTHQIRLVPSTDDYSHRWVQPRKRQIFQGPDGPREADGLDAKVQLSGSFKHNRHHPFEVVLFDDEQGYAAYHGGYAPAGAVGGLRAQSVAITAWKQDLPERINVAVGDILETPIGNFEIRDDWALHDPYLVRVKGDLRDSNVIRDEQIGDALIELYSEAWEDQGGDAGGLRGGRYRLSVTQGGKSIDFGSYVEGSHAISEWQRLVAFEKQRLAA